MVFGHGYIKRINFLCRFNILAFGIGKKSRSEELSKVVKFPNQILSVNTIRELFPGKPGYNIIYNLLEDPKYGELYLIIYLHTLIYLVQMDC